MIFRSIELKNFGLFRDVRFDLTVDAGSNPPRSVILFGGKNGAGKTTILEGVRLCLYGRRSRGERVRAGDYNSFLRSRIHRPRNGEPSDTASVCVEFDHVHAGRRQTYRVERSWRVRRGSVDEHLHVTSVDQTGHIEFDTEHWEDFVQELIPLGVSQLFFFDGEKIKAMAEEDGEDSELARSMKALLGLDLADRLRADLATYLRRQEAEAGAHGGGGLVELSAETRGHEEDLGRRRQERAHLRSEANVRKKSLREVEDRVAREGGSFGRHRESLITERGALDETLKRATASVREMCEGVLPFALIPRSCRQLVDSLEAQQTAQERLVFRRLLEERIGDVAVRVAAIAATGGGAPDLAPAVEAELRASLLPTVDEDIDPERHPVSGTGHSRLVSALSHAIHDVPRTAQSLELELETATRALGAVEAALLQVPDDDVLRPLLARLAELHQEWADLEAQVATLDEEIAVVDRDRERATKREERERERVANASAVDRRVQLVARAQRALDDFSKALTRERVSELRGHFERCYAALARKEDTVGEIRINEDDFVVTFLDQRGRSIPKAELSAGEKQIYAVAMLWALALTSGRVLPLLIDTPLGRLDSEHRANLVREYFPYASHQVLIFSTDTEIDREYFNRLRPHIASAYRLEFNDVEGETKVEAGYFWDEEESSEVEPSAA